ncbi:MAG: FAD-dependent monooxygenase, partial [Beijerinckiaceae bacterium]
MGDGPVIAIVGGGIGGLAVALALHQRGFRCDVYEQTPSLTDVGGGLNLSPNALKTFRMLDVEEEVIAAGFQDETQTVRNGETAAILAQQSRRDGVMDKYGAGFLTVHRADVQNILRARIPPERLHLGKSCVRLENMPETVRLTFADGSSVEADMAIGADGIHSAVRESLFGKQPPQFTGCMCFRGLVPVEEADNISGARDMTAWWGPHGHVIHYRVRGGSMINFVAHFACDDWAEEAW